MTSRGRRAISLLVFEASLRTGSLNERLASLIARLVEAQGGTVDRGRMAEFDCPTFDDEMTDVPPGAELLCERLAAANALVIASPEYNGSLPGGLKNVIDWVSRIRPQPFNGKQALLMSASPSMGGGNHGLWALRVPLEHLGARVYPDMFSLAQAHQAFDASGAIASDILQQRIERTVACFMDLVEAPTHYPSLRKDWVEFLGEEPNAATDRVETAVIGGH